MEWEQVDFSGPKGEPRVTLRKNMQVGMNKTFVKKYGIDQYQSVEVFFAKTEKKLGIKFSKEPAGGKKAKLIKRTNNFYFTAIELKNFYEIDASKCEFGLPTFDESQGIFILDIICSEK